MYRLPNLFLENNKLKPSSCLIKYYDNESSVKNAKTVMETNVISFLLKGEKQIILPNQKLSFDNSSFIVLKKGHYLISEKKSDIGEFKSILLFFDTDYLFSFYKKYGLKIKKMETTKSFKLLEKDSLLNSIAESLLPYLTSKSKISQDVSFIKLEEILLQIIKKNGSESLLFLFNDVFSDRDIKFQKTIEENIFNGLNVNELAFLCNMSPSAFRRHFIKIYKTSPAKWLTSKRLEKSAELLRSENNKASEIYLQVGFDSLSGFVQSFKKEFGVTPKQFQLQKMTI